MPHFCSLKSSVSDAGATVALVFEFETFAFTVTLLLRFSLRLFAFEVLVLLFERLASTINITTRPTPITATAANPPRIHQIAFDFLRGAIVGIGLTGGGAHCGGVCGVGGGGGGGVGRGLGAGCCGR